MSSPFDKRYGSKTMRHIFSDYFKFRTWRQLWVALAKAEKELGLNISDEQIRSLELCVDTADLELAEKYEKQTHHDVMAHILTYGDQCPEARPIIHLGATSCFVTDNTDVIQQRYGLILLSHRLLEVIHELVQFAEDYTGTPTVGYTHFQVAQPTTVGKRACMWIQDFVTDFHGLDYCLDNLRLLGCKGATGTAASFLELFDGDEFKVEELERMISDTFSCESFLISGQTYTRKQDFNVMQILSSIAQSASKFANDIRLLSNLGEITEPHTSKQVGSSAMPYKKNPIKCEKINALSRFVICNLQNSALTASTQWLERTLDDSANRRITIAEAFMATDEILITLKSIIKGLSVNEAKIHGHYIENLPYLITEPVLMYMAKKGLDRQDVHEVLKRMSDNTPPEQLYSELTSELVDRFGLTDDEIKALESRLTGLAEKQAKQYLSEIRERIKAFDCQSTYE